MSGQNSLLIESQYFPPIQTFELAIKSGSIEIEANEHYQKRGYRNRCLIAGPNGVQRLTIPLEKGKNTQLAIKEVKIAYIDHWQKIHWQSIQTAYGKSPFFEFYQDDLKPIFEKKWPFLFDLNMEIIHLIKDLIQLPYEISTSTQFVKQVTETSLDFRNKMTPGNKDLESSTFQNYSQVFESKNGFLSNLSILDLLFCMGPESGFYLER